MMAHHVYDICKSKELITTLSRSGYSISYTEYRLCRDKLISFILEKDSDERVPFPSHLNRKLLIIGIIMINHPESSLKSINGKAVLELPPTSHSIIHGHIPTWCYIVKDLSSLLNPDYQRMDPLESGWKMECYSLLPQKELLLLPEKINYYLLMQGPELSTKMQIQTLQMQIIIHQMHFVLWMPKRMCKQVLQMKTSGVYSFTT